MRRLALAGIWAIVSACGRTEQPRGQPSPPVQSPPRVGPIVAGLTDRWNTYVSYSGGPLLAIDGSACSASPTYRDCVHAGELRRLDLTDVTSCTGVTAVDSLAAFTWSCVETGSGVSLISSGLAPGRGLRDLLDFTAVVLRPMHLTVVSQSGQLVTDDAIWWSNPVVTAPADVDTSGAVLGDDDTIYVVPEDRATSGLNISGQGAALVTAPGVVLTPVSGEQQCTFLATATNTRQPAQCVIWAHASERLWLEIEVSSSPSLSTVLLGVDDALLLRLHESHVHRAANGLQLHDVRGGRITALTSDVNATVTFHDVHDTLARDLRFIGSEVYFLQSTDNVVENLTTVGSYAGINLQGGDTDNVFVRPLSFAHTGFGAQVGAPGNAGNVFVGYTFADVANAPAGIFGGQRQTFALGIFANAGQQGVDITDVSQTFTNLVSAMNAYNGVELENASGYERFNGQLRVGGNGLGTCDVHAAAVQPGLSATCAATDASSLAYVQTDLGSLATSFYGAVTSDDTVNQSDTNGGAIFPADPMVFDYSGAENRYRGWIAGTTLTASSRTCPASASACFVAAGAAVSLVDWRLLASDKLLRDTSLSATGNQAFVNGAACPIGLDGATVAQDTHGGEVLGDGIGNDDGVCATGEACTGNLYVIAAIEIIDDYIGDDDGLCESNEACVYAPNYGAYQGEGDYRLNQCVFADGAVQGITMYGYPTNGVVVP